jgi:hypothetical protein
VTTSSFLFEVLAENMVGDVVCVLFCKVLISFPKLLLGYSFAVFAANLASHQLNAALLLCSRQQ